MQNHNQFDLHVSGIEGWALSCAYTLFLWIRYYIAHSTCQSIHTPFDKATGQFSLCSIWNIVVYQ